MRIIYIITYLTFSCSLINKAPFYPEESQYQLSQYDLIFDSNESDVRKLDSFGYDLIEKAFVMENFGQGNIVKIAIIQSIAFFPSKTYCVCQLLQNEKLQTIICKDGIKFSDNNTKLNFVHNVKKHIIQIDESLGQCEELQSDMKNQLLCFCYSQNTLGVLTINLKNQNHQIKKLKFNFDIVDCQKKVSGAKAEIIIAFYNCSNWLLVEMSNDTLKTIFDKDEFKKQNYFDEIFKVADVLVCQSNIYLIEPYFYLILNKDNNNQYVSMIKRTNQKKIVKLIMTQQCWINIQLVENEMNYEIEFNQNDKEISINSVFYDQIIQTDQYFMLKKQNTLLVILAAFFNQTYQIESSTLMVQEQFLKRAFINKEIQNLMYQINQKTKNIQFYRFNNYLPTIKPNKRYFYYFVNFHYFFDVNKDLVLQSENYLFSSQLDKYLQEVNTQAIFTCQKRQQIQIDKTLFNLPHKIQTELISQSEKYSIIQDEDYENKCTFKLNGVPSQLIWQLKTQVEQTNILIFLFNDYLVYYDCQKEVIFQNYYIGNRQVISLKWLIFLAQLGDDEFNIINTTSTNILERSFKLKSNIRYFKQFQEQILIKLENDEFYIFDFNILNFYQLKEEFLQFGEPVFLYKNNDYRVIQINNFLIIQQRDLQLQYFFQDFGQIIRIDFSHQMIRIRSVYVKERKIQTFVYSNQMIITDQLYLIENQFDLIFPLIMSDSLQNLAIAAKQNNQSCILLIQIKNAIQMRQIIISPKLLFKQIGGQLLYLNQKNKFRIFYLETLIFQFQTPQPFMKQYFIAQNYTFRIIYYNDNHPTKEGNLKVFIKNGCYDVFNLTERIIITDTNKSSFLRISELFYGPIASIHSEDQNSLKITGPIPSYSILQTCNLNKNEGICLKYYFINQEYSIQCLLENDQNRILFCRNENLELSNISCQHLMIDQENFIVQIIKEEETYYQFLFFIDLSLNTLIQRQKIQILNLQIPENKFGYIQYELQNNILCFHNLHKKETNSHFYALKANNYIYYELKQNILSFVQIDECNDQYLISYETNDYPMKLTFQVIDFSNNTFQIVDSIKLNLSIIDFLIAKNIIQMNDWIIWSNGNKFWEKILKCQRDQNYLNITLVGMINPLTFVLFLQTDLQGQEQSFSIVKLLKNPKNFESNHNYQINHLDDNFAILSIDRIQFYYFDLKEQSQMIYHTKEYSNLTYEFKNFNNTHYFFYVNKSSEIYFGKIGYEINLLSRVENQNYTLTALNNVSSARVIIQYIEQKKLLQNFNFFTYLLSVIFSLLTLYLIWFCMRRKYYLKKNKEQAKKQMVI